MSTIQDNAESSQGIAITEFRSSPSLLKPNPESLHPSKLSILRYNADIITKSIAFISCLIFVFVVLMGSLVSLSLPQLMVEKTTETELGGSDIRNCLNPVSPNSYKVICKQRNTHSQGGIILVDVRSTHRFGILNVEFYLNNPQQQTDFVKNVTIKMSSITSSIKSFTKTFKIQKLLQETTFQLNVQQHKQSPIYNQQGRIIGFIKTVAFQPYIPQCREESCHYLINLNFQNQIKNIQDIKLKVNLVNPSFTRFTIILRFIWLIFSLIFGLISLFRYLKLEKQRRLWEHSFVVGIAISQICFNDPFYLFSIISPNPLTSFLSFFNTITYPALLIVFWQLIFKKINNQERNEEINLQAKPKVIYGAITYTLVMMNYISYSLSNENKLISHQSMMQHNRLYIMSALLILGQITLVCIQVFKIIVKWNKTSRLQWRNLIITGSWILMVISIGLICLVSGLPLYANSGMKKVVIYGVINIYGICLQYFYNVPEQFLKANKQLQYQSIKNENPLYDHTQSELNSVEIFLQHDQFLSRKQKLRKYPQYIKRPDMENTSQSKEMSSITDDRIQPNVVIKTIQNQHKLLLEQKGKKIKKNQPNGISESVQNLDVWVNNQFEDDQS